MYSAHLRAKKSTSGIEAFLAWVKNNYPDALEQYQIESKDEIELFIKYVQNLRRPSQDLQNIVDKIKEMELI
jgi:hypothetical protein